MAQKVLLVYEDQALPSAAVCMLFERYDKDGQWPYQENLPMYYGTDSGSLVTILGSTAASVWRHQLKRSGSLSELHLADLLRDYRSLQCETLHDKVCVLRSLVDEELLDADYSISSHVLYSRVFTIIPRPEQIRTWFMAGLRRGL